MNTSQAPQQGGELHEPPTEVDRGQCEHYQQHIYICRVVFLTGPPDFQYQNEKNLLSQQGAFLH